MASVLTRVARLGVALATTAIAAGAAPLRAQDAPALHVTLPADSLLTRRGPLVSATGMLGGERLQQLLLAGFPARFHFRVELWSEAFIIDRLQRADEWDVLVRWVPTDRMYEVFHIQDDRPLPLGRFAAIADAERAVARPNVARVAAHRGGRPQYYQATLVVESLSERDLDDVSRWLQGDIEPGITGRANPASVLSRGIRTLASRLLGGERVEYQATTAHFRVP
ncbi:MAG TPA: hypothetical protein VG916_14915 [Gemmatimonadaceae bacterium]|nr:hypothetical protein [Gemmatimonadaceae bacterium]